MSRILVTGGAGFIGSNFIRYWSTTHPEDEILNLDKLTYAGNLESLEDMQQKHSDRYVFVQGDICDETVVDKAMEGVEVVVHFAAESHVDRSIMDPAIFMRTNALGTQVLLEASKKHQIKRFHHISTDEVFGSLPLDSEEKWDESTPYNPRSPYSASKAAADHLARAYFNTYGLPVTITNCANNIGPYMFPEKLISVTITNLLEGKKAPIYSPGSQVREWLWVEDHAKAIDLILQKGKVGETYFVGPDNPELSNLEIVKKILKIMNLGEDMLEMVRDRPGHDQRYAMDWSKIKNDLGWQPQVGIDEALQRLVDWFKANEQWWKPLKKKNREYFQKQYDEI